MVDRRLLALYTTTTTIMMTFGLISPFLPLLAAEKHVDSGETGLIFSVYPAGSLLASPIVGLLLSVFGRRNTLVATHLITALALAASGLSVYMEAEGFIIANVFSRFLGGMACGTMFTVENALIASDYSENILKYVGINESCVGLALILGPLVGAGLYVALGAAGTFFSASLFFLIFGMLVFFILGKDRPYRAEHKDTNFLALALQPRILLVLVPILYYMFTSGGILIFFPTHLKANGMSDTWIVTSYTLTGIGYLIICVVLAHTIADMNKQIVSSISLLGSIIGIALLGPYPDFLPQSVITILIGWGLLPFASGALFIVVLPSLVQVASSDLGLGNDDKLLDKVSGTSYVAIMTIMLSLGNLTGPLVAGWGLSYVDAREMCGLYAGLGAAIWVLYVAAICYLKTPKVASEPLVSHTN